MKVTVTTRELLGMLTDLLSTAGEGNLAAIHLRTRPGYWKDEPGRTTLLTGVSSSGVVGGHTWVLASGTLPPTVVALTDVKAVVAVFKPAVAKHGSDHTVDIEVDTEHQVTIRETPALFEAGTELVFTGWDPVLFPYSRVADALADTTDVTVKRLGVEVPDGRATSWGGAAMRALLAVEKRRGADLRLWRLHSSGRHLAQIGDEWRGFIFARVVDPELVEDAPTADLNVEPSDVADESPEALAEWSRLLFKGLGIPEPKPDAEPDQPELPEDDDDPDPQS